MPFSDLSPADLAAYRPPLTRQPDFDDYWADALAESASAPLNVETVHHPYPVRSAVIERLTFAGATPGRIAAWLLTPANHAPGERHPAMVFYHGYSGFKGDPYDYLGWTAQGYVVLAVDVRGQSGDSADFAAYPGGHVTGWMTQGITDPASYYYRGVYQDTTRAVDVVASLPTVDPDRIGVSGVSQGGGLSLVAAALNPRVRLSMPSVPFLCHFARSMQLADRGPYPELTAYCHRHPDRLETVLRTLSYVDVMNLAPRITCHVLMTVGLRDDICPASTVYATYHHLTQAQSTEMLMAPFGAHDVFPTEWERKLATAERVLRS